MWAGVCIAGVNEDDSAPICASTVFSPWPKSQLARLMTNVPVVVMWMSAWVGSPPKFMPVG
jgi:hypothetical protein